jgi:hypothetical protein
MGYRPGCPWYSTSINKYYDTIQKPVEENSIKLSINAFSSPLPQGWYSPIPGKVS